jgi:hypothetical protein
MIKYIVIFLIVFSIVLVQVSAQNPEPQELYLITVEVKDGNYRIVDKELSEGFVPQVYDGGVFDLSDDSSVLVSGNYPLPREVIYEQFLEDGSIEGEVEIFEGVFSIALPYNSQAENVILKDEEGKEIASVDVSELKPERDFGELFSDYWWVGLAIILVILFIVWIVRRR